MGIYFFNNTVCTHVHVQGNEDMPYNTVCVIYQDYQLLC